jgi:hypothetical protein
MWKTAILLELLVLSFLSSACSTTHVKPCTQGGQPSRTTPVANIGRKSCDQILDDGDISINHGKYYEWYLNDKIAVVGEYTRGKKTGHWVEYDEEGNVTDQFDYIDGKPQAPSYEVRKTKKTDPAEAAQRY